MRLQVLQEELSKALSLATRFASAKAQLPVLGNILFTAKGGKLLISSTNLEISVNISIGAKVEDDGEITIPAKVITDIISNLNPGQISLTSNKESVEIVSSEFESTISGMNPQDFPSVPKKLEKIDLSLPREELTDALGNLLFSVSVDETRPVLTGVLFLCQRGGLTMVSTDGYRLSQQSLKGGNSTKVFTAILPKSVLSEIARLSEGDMIDFFFDKENNQIVFKSENVILSSRILDGSFPDYEKIIPKTHMLKISVDKEDLVKGVKLAAVFARDSANIVKFNIKNKQLEINAESQISGRQKTKMDIRSEGENLEIAFNYRFLEEVLQVIDGEDVDIEFSGPSSPAIFKDPKNKNFLHLIMPIKLES